MITTGDVAPPFEAVDQKGELVRLEAFRGAKNVVLFFYPRSFTPGCTREVCSFRDAFDELEAADTAVVGVSRDKADTQQRFGSAYQVPFALLADSSGAIATAYGVGGLLGNLLNITRRVTFVIDKGGVVRGAFRHELAIEKHLANVRSTLRTLA